MAIRTSVRQIGLPRRVQVICDRDGIPTAVARRSVAHVRDEWRVDEGWWTGAPTRRRYFDLVLEDGRNIVVFWDQRDRHWFSQRG
jgi:hypothetical protein